VIAGARFQRRPRPALTLLPSLPAVKGLLALGLALAVGSPRSAFGQVPTTNAPAVTLAWDASPSGAVVTNYTLFMGTNSGQYVTNWPAGTNLYFTVSNLSRGPEYFFAVNCQGAGGLSSPFSSEATYQTLALPAAVTGLHVIVITP
jgi:hypothetical protein